MDIKITKLELTNFKCFRHKEITFNDGVTIIKGRNGVGKTTIADAILWCLFGKNSQGQSDFDLKTHDDNGHPIPHLDHSVELEFDVSGVNEPSFCYNLKRTLKETWLKKRGSDEQVFKNNTTEYMINGEVKTAGDYKKCISELISEDVFKCITNPSYFPSLKWQEQREFLSKLAGHIDVEENDDFKKLLAYMSQENSDIIAYRKHLSYQIKQVKDKLEKIPVRLEEQNKALPEKLDWEQVQSEYDKAKKGIEEVDKKILSIKSGNGQDLKKEELRKQLDTLHAEKNKIENALWKQNHDTISEYDGKIIELSHRFSSLLNDQRDIEGSVKSFETLIERCNETMRLCEKDAEQIRKEWYENEKSRLKLSEEDSVCPTCGQELPAELYQERITKLNEEFNKIKAEKKEELQKRAEKVKALRSDTEDQINEYKSKKTVAEAKLCEVNDNINATFVEKQKTEKEKASLPPFDSVVINDEKHIELEKKIESILHEIDNASITSEDDKKQLESLAMGKALSEETIKNLSIQMASKDQYDRIQSLIEGINEEQKELVTQLSELERKEDVARRYQDRQNQILEERINEHFSLVQWKMFRTVNNGGDPYDEPYCECYVNGVAYHDGLNQAARLNSGLDIIRTLCKHYNVSAPIVIDNSESNLNIIQTESQQIRLEVADTELQIL